MKEALTYKKIFSFWLPLSATWLMMSVEGPFLTAVIARMADPEYNLAAYGIAFSLALIVESPVIMMMSASIALVKDKESFKTLRNFVYYVNLLITCIILLLIIPSFFYSFTVDLMGLPLRVAQLTHNAVILLIPWPAAIGYRRFYQGIMISSNSTRRVAYGTIIRMSSMFIVAILLIYLFRVDGVVVGAAALSSGVIMEALASRFMARKFVKKIKEISKHENGEGLTYRSIFKFYYPLALTSFISLGVQPVVTFFMGQSRMALESLAVLPVLNSLVFFFRSFGLSYQEVGIALMGERENYRRLRNFAGVMAISVVAGLGLIAFTPLSEIWFKDVAGLSEQLSNFSIFPLMIYSVFPATTVIISFQRAILVYSRNTRPITYATFIEVAGITLMLLLAIKVFSLIGVVAAVISYLAGRVAAILYLMKPFKKETAKI